MPDRILRMVFYLLILTVPLQNAHADRILWDIGHGPLEDYTLDGEYRELRDRFESIGFELQNGDQPIDFDALWDIDILVCSVLSNYDHAYSEDEVERIAAFVNGGGSLVILADVSDHHPENIEPLLDRFGLSAAQGEGMVELNRFNDLPVFERVESVEFDDGETVGADEEEGGRLVAFDGDGRPGIAVNDGYNGKIILIGDADLWTNRMID
ncbi:MAG TPA: hypothetical protein ENL08_06425, partial [Bacteroidetes bacterium]|nr:hypothetical protein [Bacteroidota bacterium]